MKDELFVDIKNRGLVGLKYNNWHYVGDGELTNMIYELLNK